MEVAMYNEDEGVYLCFVNDKIKEIQDYIEGLQYRLEQLEDMVQTLRGMHDSRDCPKCGGHVSLREFSKRGIPEIYCMDCGEVLLTGYAKERNLVEAWNRGSNNDNTKRK